MSQVRPNRIRFNAPWVIFWAAFSLRVLVIVIGHTYKLKNEDHHFNFGFEAGRIAASVVTGRGYGNPFNGPSGPTAWLPPLYPLLMALAFKLFGVYSRGAALFLMIGDSAFSAAIAPAVYEIAARCFDAKGVARRSGKFLGRPTQVPVALWSGWLWAVYPAALQYAIHWLWEMSLTACLFTWVVVVTLRLRGVGSEPKVASAGGSMDLWAVFGALWGLVALSNASLLLCLPAMVLWVGWPWLRRGPGVQLRSCLAGAVMAGVVFCAVMTPWWVRNVRVLHAFVTTRSNLGVELYQASKDSYNGLPWGTAMPLWAGDPEFQTYVRMGEIAYARQRGAQAMARFRAQPGRFWRLTGDRVLFYWDGTPHPTDGHPAQEYLRELSYSFLSLCGLLGLGWMLRCRVEGAGLIAAIFALMPLAYYVVTVQARFRHPMEPLIAVLAVYLFRSTEAKRVASPG